MTEEGGSETDESQVAALILEYMQRHPEAKDTAEGIAQWWLQQGRIEPTVDTVRGALALLRARDQIVERRAPDGRTYYSLKSQTRLKEGT